MADNDTPTATSIEQTDTHITLPLTVELPYANPEFCEKLRAKAYECDEQTGSAQDDGYTLIQATVSVLLVEGIDGLYKLARESGGDCGWYVDGVDWKARP